MAAGVEQLQHGAGGREAGGEGEATGAVLQPRRAALVGEARGVMAARVLKALVLAGARLRIGGGGVDRRHDRAGAGVGGLAGVDGTGARAPVLLVGVGAAAMVRHGGILVKSNREF